MYRTSALALTAYAHPEDRIQILAAGFDGHLPKPVDPVELIRSVHDYGHSAKRNGNGSASADGASEPTAPTPSLA